MRRAQEHTSFPLWIPLLTTTLVFSWVTPTMAATQEEIQEWLQAHNNYRTLHGVPSVSWSETVATSAQAYADTCPTSHSSLGYGENLAWASPASYNPGISAIVQWWYDEEPDYDYNDPGFSSETGHFTQVVWKGTTEIGCGFATGCSTSNRANVWVCQYNPPGNYLGRFADNVFPPDPGSSPTTTVLTNKVPEAGLTGVKGTKSYFLLDVPGTATKLEFKISGGIGDADLYIKYGSLPSESSYECRPRLDGNDEICSSNSPQAGTYYIMIQAYASFSDLTLLGSFGSCNKATVIAPVALLLL